MKTVLFIGIGALAVCTSAAYPSTFPFENENYVPGPPAPGTPNLTFDPETDTGGYLYYQAWLGNDYLSVEPYTNSNGQTWPGFSQGYWAPQLNGFTQFLMVNTFAAPPLVPDSVWNCTAKNNIWADSDYTGTIKGDRICSVGACCEHVIGHPKFSDDAMDWHQAWDGKTTSAMCDAVSEQIYCILVGGDFQLNCNEYYLTVETRLAIMPCYDSYALFFLSCSVYVSGAFTWTLEFEPPMWLSDKSAEEQMIANSFAMLQDRVCHPYSYYSPPSSSTSDSATPSEGSSSSNVSSSAYPFAASMAAVTTVLLL